MTYQFKSNKKLKLELGIPDNVQGYIKCCSKTTILKRLPYVTLLTLKLPKFFGLN